jgi:hypothetical protein
VQKNIFVAFKVLFAKPDFRQVYGENNGYYRLVKHKNHGIEKNRLFTYLPNLKKD